MSSRWTRLWLEARMAAGPQPPPIGQCSFLRGPTSFRVRALKPPMSITCSNGTFFRHQFSEELPSTPSAHPQNRPGAGLRTSTVYLFEDERTIIGTRATCAAVQCSRLGQLVGYSGG